MPGLQIRLAESRWEIEAAQSLRYRVFYQEGSADASKELSDQLRDFDEFDDSCEHMLVLDSEVSPAAVVGTYRLLRSSVAGERFYSASEYDLSPLLEREGELLEVGRSCVAPGYRSQPTMQLLWNGLAKYVFQHNISLLFGCASFPGTDLQALAQPLSYLYFNHLAPVELRVRALSQRYLDMRLVEPEQLVAKNILAGLPPLIKGYLRLGGFVGDGAVIDTQFNTTDVFIVVKPDLVKNRYYRHYRNQNPQV